MREILLRAKRIDNGEWIYWNLWGELIRESDKRTRIAVKKGATTSYYDYVHQIRHLIDESTVSEYIGLCDKNGRKIFENDIVTSGSDSTGRKYYSAVYYDEFNCTCCNGVYGWTFAEGYGDIRDYKEYEVVGNIFDNADLLKETVIEDEEPSEYVEQDTKCDLCKYNGECESKIEITNRRDTRKHYIRWFNEYCKLESEESDGTTEI